MSCVPSECPNICDPNCFEDILTSSQLISHVTHQLGDLQMSSRFGRWARSVAFAVFLVILATTNRAGAQLCGQLGGVNFTENFNSLASIGASNSVPNSFEFAFNKSS